MIMGMGAFIECGYGSKMGIASTLEGVKIRVVHVFTKLAKKCWTYDHGIGLFIDTPFFYLIFGQPFFHLIFGQKSKFLFLINGRMYSPQIYGNF
jgi:hypothetical protein